MRGSDASHTMIGSVDCDLRWLTIVTQGPSVSICRRSSGTCLTTSMFSSAIHGVSE
jgi:hypothetical protein